MHWKMRNVYTIVVGKPEKRRQLGRPKLKWEENMKMDLSKMGLDNMDWINWLRIGSSVNTTVSLWTPQATGLS